MRNSFLKYALVAFQLFCYTVFSFAQSNNNLLPNGNFELRTGNPITWGQSNLLKYWKGIANGKWSPITYFYEFEDRGYIPTWKEGGRQIPYSGNGFIGLGIAFKNVEEVGSQYFETELLTPLEKDSTYIISAFVSLADRLKYALDYIPVALSDRTMLSNNGTPIYSSNLIKLKTDQPYLNNTTEWIKISAKYKARGGELFFLIGGIEGNKKLGTEFKLKKMPFHFSFHYILLNKLTYYFIDNISIQKQHSLIELPQDTIIPNANLLKNTKDKIILSDITFEVNSYVLKDTINEQLNRLVLELLNCSDCDIKITGYTDNTGPPEKNIKLSMMRAKTVYEYLNNKGIPHERMYYEGLGENYPIENNNLPNGRSKNRRVEIQIFRQ